MVAVGIGLAGDCGHVSRPRNDRHLVGLAVGAGAHVGGLALHLAKRLLAPWPTRWGMPEKRITQRAAERVAPALERPERARRTLAPRERCARTTALALTALAMTEPTSRRQVG